MPDFDTIVKALRRWAAVQDAHDRAALELLAWHEGWLRRRDFLDAATGMHGRVMYLSWRKAREFHDSNPVGSTSELAILDLAVAIGENRYRLSLMGSGHAKAIVRAFAMALGEEAGTGSPAAASSTRAGQRSRLPAPSPARGSRR